MWQYVFILLRRQLSKSVLASSGFLLAACALVLLSATTQTTVVQANQAISASWRSSYDLVVLPPQANVSSKSIVPGDLLEGYDGGISIQQYENIKRLLGVEVAAPIAFIGYAQMPVPQLQFFPRSLSSGYYRLNLALMAFNGQRQILEHSTSVIYYYLSSCNDQFPSQDILDALDKRNIVVTCGSEQFTSSKSLQVDPGTFLLSAVDPIAENQLVHLDRSITSGRMLTSQDDLHNDTNTQIGTVGVCTPGEMLPSWCHIPNNDIPVLFHTQLPGKTTLQGNLTRLAPITLDPRIVLAHDGVAYLAHIPNQSTVFNGLIPLVQNDPQRFSVHTIAWDGHSWQPYTSLEGDDPVTSSLKFLSIPSGLTYQPAVGPTGSATTAYTLIPKGVRGPEVAFRELHSLHIAEHPKHYEPYALPAASQLPSTFYFFEPVGKFGDTSKAQFTNQTNWLPENTYTSPPTILRYDVGGHAVTSTNMLPTTNATGFILQPPLAVTTLKVAEHLRGESIISAIRIRVEGVESANPASWKRVQQVAQLIERQTGLHALVTLGSSPKPTLVYVPGIQQGQFGSKQNIEPVGWVEERWIAIGVSILYLAQLGMIRLLLLGAVLVVCLSYLVVAFSTLVTTQRTEFAILSALGWRPWHHVQLFLIQGLLLAIGGGVIGLGIALLITVLIGATPIWLIVMGTLPAMLVIAFLSSLYPFWYIWHIWPAEVLRPGSSIRKNRAKLFTIHLRLSISSFRALVIYNLTRSRPRTLMTITNLLCSVILLMLMFNSILALHQNLKDTLLGNSVLLQTAVPQIVGCIFAVLLTFLSVADMLLLQVRERRREIGLLQSLGWQLKTVQSLFVLEAMVLAILSTLPGVLIAQWILNTLHVVQNIVPSPLIALCAILLIVLVIALAIIPALRTINRMQVADVLRSE